MGIKCQCPKSSNNHFYRKDSMMNITEEICVNALSRAITISTVWAKKEEEENDSVSMP